MGWGRWDNEASAVSALRAGPHQTPNAEAVVLSGQIVGLGCKAPGLGNVSEIFKKFGLGCFDMWGVFVFDLGSSATCVGTTTPAAACLFLAIGGYRAHPWHRCVAAYPAVAPAGGVRFPGTPDRCLRGERRRRLPIAGPPWHPILTTCTHERFSCEKLCCEKAWGAALRLCHSTGESSSSFRGSCNWGSWSCAGSLSIPLCLPVRRPRPAALAPRGHPPKR